MWGNFSCESFSAPLPFSPKHEDKWTTTCCMKLWLFRQWLNQWEGWVTDSRDKLQYFYMISFSLHCSTSSRRDVTLRRASGSLLPRTLGNGLWWWLGNGGSGSRLSTTGIRTCSLCNHQCIFWTWHGGCTPRWCWVCWWWGKIRGLFTRWVGNYWLWTFGGCRGYL